jgi:hypothetical protein
MSELLLHLVVKTPLELREHYASQGLVPERMDGMCADGWSGLSPDS